MPAKDLFHEAVRQALINDAWTITHDPFCMRLDDSDSRGYIDLAAEKILAAEKSDLKIAVEIKSFLSSSLITDFHTALGQFLGYRLLLREQEPERHLWLAVPSDIWKTFFSRRFIQSICQEYQLSLLVFHPKKEVIVAWKK